MDLVGILATILELIPDLLVTSGGQLMTGGVYTGGRYLTSRLMDHVDFYGGARRRRKRRLNQWVRFLVKMRKAFNKKKIRKGRFNIARDLYREFKRTGQLNKILKTTDVPKEILKRLDDILGSTEAIKKASLESGLPEIVSTEKSIEKAKEEAAKEELHEAMDEATKSIVEAYNVSPETQKELVKEAVEQKQQELLQLGNEKALDKDVVEQAAAQAAVTAPNKTATESIIEATSELTGTPTEVIKKDAQIISDITKLIDFPIESKPQIPEELSFLGLETEEPPYTKTEPLEESGNPAFVESTVMPLESTPVGKSKLEELRKELKKQEREEIERGLSEIFGVHEKSIESPEKTIEREAVESIGTGIITGGAREPTKYNLFIKKEIGKLRKKYPNKKPREIFRMAAQRWKSKGDITGSKFERSKKSPERRAKKESSERKAKKEGHEATRRRRKPNKYNLFIKEEIGKLRKKYPNKKPQELFRMAAKMWRSKSDTTATKRTRSSKSTRRRRPTRKQYIERELKRLRKEYPRKDIRKLRRMAANEWRAAYE